MPREANSVRVGAERLARCNNIALAGREDNYRGGEGKETMIEGYGKF